MRDDFDELNEVGLNQDLHLLKADLKRLQGDITSILWKSTFGQVQQKIARRPISTVLLAFGAGFVVSRIFRLFKSNSNQSRKGDR